MGKMKKHYWDLICSMMEIEDSSHMSKKETIHIGNYKTEEEWPRDYDLDFVDPHGDVDERNS